MTDFDDDELLRLVHLAADDSLGDVPDHLHSFAVDAERWLDVDAELAEMTDDSAEVGLVGARADETAGARVVVFTARRLSVELTIDGSTVLGQLVPPEPATVTVESSTELVVRADELGLFRFDAPAAPTRLVIDAASGKVATPWLSL
jgi:hypothetical protein